LRKKELLGVELYSLAPLITQARLKVKNLGRKMTTLPVLKNSWTLSEAGERLLRVRQDTLHKFLRRSILLS